MKTSTSRISKERIYGILKFEMNGNKFQLKVYQSKDSASDNKEDLLLPFLDETNGIYTYGGGRYMDVFKSNINTNGTIELNFNNTYNTYCAYNEDYSCPLTPRDNHLSIEILAGIKDFKKH